MGCVSSKQAVSVTPALDYSGVLHDNAASGSRRNRVGSFDSEKKKKIGSAAGESGRESSTCGSESVRFRLGNLQKYVEGEQVAAGWPPWLAAVAGEAIHGWVPLRADAFEKLEKIGQGTYSSVFRARDLATGKIVALKKVRFDYFEQESVRFMAREILILRKLDHPNIIKLEGIITSRLSCNIILVFEYMEHDLSGLSSCPEIKFSEAQPLAIRDLQPATCSAPTSINRKLGSRGERKLRKQLWQEGLFFREAGESGFCTIIGIFFKEAALSSMQIDGETEEKAKGIEMRGLRASLWLQWAMKLLFPFSSTIYKIQGGSLPLVEAMPPEGGRGEGKDAFIAGCWGFLGIDFQADERDEE
ncbi:Protein IMPAIRED IN BABA-INDUCED STERILITY 1 [Ancistrocladus abbreviatus]